MNVKAFLQDRRKVMLTAGAIGGGLGLIVLARRGGSGAEQPAAAPAPELLAGAATPYSFDGVDAAMVDSQNASAIVEQIGQLSSGVANIESTVSSLTDMIASGSGPAPTAPAPVAPAPVAPQPAAPVTPAPQPPAPSSASNLPRWTPPTNVRIGGATDIAGATFAGRTRLSNGQYAPIVRYANGTSQIHPSWQKWMAANRVTRTG